MTNQQSRPRVLAPTTLNSYLHELLDPHVELVPWSKADDPIDGIYCYGHSPVDGTLIDRCRQLRIISNHGVGVDHIDLAAAKSRGIPVGNTPNVLDGAVADLGIGLMIAAARRFVEGDRFARHPDTGGFGLNDRHGRDVHASTLGILGMGNIGMQIAKRACGFDMKILYHSRNRKPEAEQRYGVEYRDLEGLLREADFVIIIVPLTDSTRGLINYRELSWMKPTSTLINIARGPIVDTFALTDAMENRRIFAAALDVTDPEPLPRHHPLLRLDNVTITPHIGSATFQTRRRMADLSVANLLAGLRGEELHCRCA